MVCLQDVTVTVLCYTLPILVRAVHELRSTGPGPAAGLYAAIVVLLVLASSAYSTKWPERWAPGRFDLIGNSHQVLVWDPAGVRVHACMGDPCTLQPCHVLHSASPAQGEAPEGVRRCQ